MHLSPATQDQKVVCVKVQTSRAGISAMSVAQLAVPKSIARFGSFTDVQFDSGRTVAWRAGNSQEIAAADDGNSVFFFEPRSPLISRTGKGQRYTDQLRLCRSVLACSRRITTFHVCVAARLQTLK